MLRTLFLSLISALCLHGGDAQAQSASTNETECSSIIAGNGNTVEAIITCNFMTGAKTWSIETLSEALSACDHHTVQYFIENGATSQFLASSFGKGEIFTTPIVNFLRCGQENADVQSVVFEFLEDENIATARIENIDGYQLADFFWLVVLSENLAAIKYMVEKEHFASAATLRQEITAFQPLELFAFPLEFISNPKNSFANRQALLEVIGPVVSSRTEVCRSEIFRDLPNLFPKEFHVKEQYLGTNISSYLVKLDKEIGIVGKPKPRFLWLSASAFPRFLDGSVTGPDAAAIIIDLEFPDIAIFYRNDGSSYKNIRLNFNADHKIWHDTDGYQIQINKGC